MEKTLKNLNWVLINISSNIETAEKRINDISRLLFDNKAHFGITCKKCKITPITGSRFVCTKCEDFSLCWRCEIKNTHEHKSFVELNKNFYHEKVFCNGCKAGPIQGLRFKCKICDHFGSFYLDFCLSCKNTKNHIHDFFEWPPFMIKLISSPIGKVSYYPSEEFFRSWTVFNEGNEPLKKFFIVCTAGDCCSNAYAANSPNYVFDDIIIPEKSSREIFINDFITQTTPGYYKSEWRLASSITGSIFGPKFYYDLFIISRNKIN